MALEYDWRPVLLDGAPSTELIYDARDDNDNDAGRLRAERDEWRRLASFAQLEYRFASDELRRLEAGWQKHADCDSKLRDLKREHAAALKAANARLDAANADIAELVGAQRRRNNARNEGPDPRRAERVAFGLAMALQLAQREQEDALDDQRRAHDELVDDLRTAHERQLETMRAEHEEYVKALAAEQKADVDALERALADKSARLDATLADLSASRAEAAQLREDRDAQTAALATRTDELAATRADLTTTQSELADAKQQLAAAQKDLHAARLEVAGAARGIAGTQKELDALAGALQDAQAALDEQAQDLADARKELDIAHGALRESEHALDVRTAEREGARREVDTTKAERDALKTEGDALKTQLDAGRTQLDAANNELTAARTDLATRSAELEARLRELDDAGAQLGETTRALASARGEAASLARQLEDARALLAAGSVDAGEMAALRAEMELKTRQLADAWGMLDVANGELDGARTQLDAARTELDASRTAHADELKTLQDKIESKAAEVDKVRDELDTAQAELAAADKARELLDAVAAERDDARARVAAMVKELRAAEGRAAGLDEALLEVAALGKELSVARERLDAFKNTDDAQDDLRAQLDAAQIEAADVAKELDAVRQQLAACRSQLDTALRTRQAASPPPAPAPALMQDFAALENELAALRADNAALNTENTGQLALIANLQRSREVIRELEARVGRRNEQIGLHQRDIARLETNLRLAEDALEDVEEMRRERECAVEDGRMVREERDDLVRRLEDAEERCEELKRRLGEENSVAGLTGLLSPAIVAEARRVDAATPVFLAVPPPQPTAPPSAALFPGPTSAQQKQFVETEVDATGMYDYVDTSRDPIAATANFDFDLSNLRRSILSSSLDFRSPAPFNAPRPSTQAVDGHGVDDTMEFVLSGGRAGSGLGSGGGSGRTDHAAATYDFLDLQTSIASAYPATANGGSVRADSVFTQQLQMHERPNEEQTRSMEVQILLGQLEDARGEIARLRVQVQQAERVDEVRADLDEARAELAVLRAKMPVEDAMREVEALQAQLEDARAELDEMRTRAEDAEQLRAELDDARAELEDARAELEDARGEHERLRGRMQVEDATRDLADLTRRVEVDALGAEVAAREEEARALVGVVFDLVAQRRREAAVRAKERPSSYMRLSELVVVPRGDETVAWKIGELRDHVVQLEQEIQDLHATLGEAKEHTRDMERELNETKGALLDARADLLKKELELADRGTQDLSQVDTLRADLETARALSADLESKLEILANNLRAARTKNEQDRLTHRRKVLELEIAADDAEERAGEVEARAEEAEQRVAELEARVQELEPAAAKVTELEARIVELRVVEMRVAELEGAVIRASELEVLVGELEAKRDELLKELDGGRAALRRAEADKVALDDDVRGLQAELARGVTGRDELEHRLGRMDDELMMLRARLIDRDTELAGLSGQLHRAQLELEDAQERAAKAVELEGRVDVLEADIKTRDDEAEEAYDKLLETMKEKKRLEARVESLTRKVHALQEKLVELQAQPLPPRPAPTTSVSDPQLHVQTALADVGGRPRSASGGLETASTPILVPAPPGGPPPTRTASSPAVVFGAPILSRPPSTASTAPPRPPSATVPPIDAMPRLQPRTASSSSILQRAPSPKMQRAPSGSNQQPLSASSSRHVSTSRQVSGAHPPRAGELRPSASPRSRAGSQEPRSTTPLASAPDTRQRSASTRVPSGDHGRSTTPPASMTLASRRMPTQAPVTAPSPRRPSVAAAAARTDVRSMAAALTSAPQPAAASSNPRKRPAPEEFDQSLVVGAVPVPVPTSPERPSRPPTSHRRGFTPKRSSGGRPLLAPPSPIANRFGGDLTNSAAGKERPMLGRSWLGKALAAPPAAPQASSAVDSPGFGRVEAMRARFAK